MIGNRLATALFPLTLAALLALPAPTQSLNIDYRDGSNAGSPLSSGAGLPGGRNSLSGLHWVPETLVGLNGTPLSAVVMLIDVAAGACFPSTIPEPRVTMDWSRRGPSTG